MLNDFEIEKDSRNQPLKRKKLILGILFDAIGMVSYTIPLIGDFSDVVWAPLAGFLMTKMYQGRVGKVAGILTFIEEIVPFMDVIPSFTLTWIYTYWIKGKDNLEIMSKKRELTGGKTKTNKQSSIL